MFEVATTAVDVAANQIGIRQLQIVASPNRPFQDAIAEAGRKPLDLRLNPVRHVES
jgi:hypothetical protein